MAKRMRVTARQEGGDDGYQYVVRVDGCTKINGLNKRMADYYKRKFRKELGLDPETEKPIG